MSNNEYNKVLIIGAGPGGLALAQILRKKNIPCEVFERDENLSQRRQGWAVVLAETLPELESLLPDDMTDIREASVNHGVEVDDQLAVVDAGTAEVLAMLGGVPWKAPGYILRANRERFRDFLWQKLPVTLGKKFDHYTEDENGVTAHFQDGTQARGAVLVGCDGVHSRVRHQLMDGQGDETVPSVYIPIIGECTIPAPQYEPIRKISNAALVSGLPGIRFVIGQSSIASDQSSASYFWSMCYRVDDPVAESADVLTASKEILYQLALSKAEGMAPVLTNMIRHTGVEGMITPGIKFVEFVSPTSLPCGRVTLLGDAAHVMIPMKGAGANTAVHDACDLGKLVISAEEKSDPVDWQQLLKDYESVMLPRGAEKVLSSRAAGDGPNSLDALIQGRMNTLQQKL